MVGWHHRINGHDLEKALVVCDGQGGLACCIPWGRKESDVTERLNWTEAGFRKSRGTEDQIANIHWIIEKAREFQKNIYFCFIDYAKAFDCVDHNKLWKTLKEVGILDHLTCLLQNLYADQEATVRTGHGTTHWFQSSWFQSSWFTYCWSLAWRILSITLLACEMSAIVR